MIDRIDPSDRGFFHRFNAEAASAQLASVSSDRRVLALPRPPRFRQTGREAQRPPDCRITAAPRANRWPWNSTQHGVDNLHALCLMTDMMGPADPGRTAPESRILWQDEAGEAIRRVGASAVFASATG
jgi:hypothetical protein